ncbi:N-acetyltransferase [Pseudomonas cavernicola]|uniref:N-acetyltransferase n=1 Tax=Pseudomonas cavernicola TaxID=2320866 RepID=A0A418XK46_9PSED|nr:GNAT family protein [Pseudomonas cavernicola]RJG12806.1 N-acetyltransferase [Pseudomonas cavernicola]
MSNEPLLHWQPANPPERQPLSGQRVRLEPLDPARHGNDLWQALQGPQSDPALWDYMAYGPFSERSAFDAWLAGNAATSNPLFYTVIDLASASAQGLLSFLNIVPAHGSIEIGNICYGRAMQRTAQASEVIYLLAKYAFELGYRRLEWKCNAQNARSKRAAERFGFGYEGLFRQHMVIKDRNRDTAWYAMLDSEWPAVRRAFERWLAAENFDAAGQQRQTLAALRNG